MRILTCGSVDHGKSTLLGRMLYDADVLLEDQIAHVQKNNMDYACLFDGLEDERKQGITIDVAYRYIQTVKRSFIFIDAPGHKQYTRNMITGATQAERALLLCDVTEGITEQTQRHLSILESMGLRDIYLCVNKMDLVDYDESVFDTFAQAFAPYHAIPVSALHGDNLVHASPKMPWYKGRTLWDHLENDPESHKDALSFTYLPIQQVMGRHYAGNLFRGRIEEGQPLIHLPSQQVVHVKEKIAFGNAHTLTLQENIDITRGDVLVDDSFPGALASWAKVRVIPLEDVTFDPQKEYWLKIGHMMILCRLQDDHLTLAKPTIMTTYTDGWFLGAGLLIDPLTKKNLAAILMEEMGDRLIHPYALTVSAAERAVQKNQKPLILWFTGMSGVGKSTLANRVEQNLYAMGFHTYLLDGDNVRSELCKGLGFDEESRKENIRRIASVAKMMVEAGLIVIVSAVSPFRHCRDQIKQAMNGTFIEIHLDAPIEVCQERDPKKLYESGVIQDVYYEPPLAPDLYIRTDQTSVSEATKRLVTFVLEKQGRKS